MEFQEDAKTRLEDTDRTISTSRIAEDLSAATRRAKSNIAEAADSAKTEARRIASEQKDAGAAKLGEVAGAVHGAARSLETGMPQMASYIHDAAARLENAATALRHRSVDDLMSEISSFARSQPVVFFGGAMIAGFALTRFLRSSGTRAGQDWQQPNVGGR
jgi:ABC-type transporter Mla subunit MlaD